MTEYTNFTTRAAGFGLALALSWLPVTALAAGCNCVSPPPPPPPPPANCGCNHGGGNHNNHHHGGNNNYNNQNVNISLNVVTKADVNASSTVSSTVSSVLSNTSSLNGQLTAGMTNSGFNLGAVIVSGGGGGGAGASEGVESELNIVAPSGGGEREAESEEERTKVIKVVIQAFCFDDKDVPHPASQVFAERDVAEEYAGEVYRCIAGTHMQVTVAPWREQISFAGGQTITCGKGEALYHTPAQGGGRLVCRAQAPARDCNERSLLRRFGAGIKVLTMVITERYTSYQHERTQSSSTGSSSFSSDGGVMN